MAITLTQILNLVGKLDDTPGEETARERFRKFLKENIKKVGEVRDYIEECLRNKGTQYNRALQDLVNYVGEFLGFKVKYGRYQGVQGEVGFDGHWISPKNFHIVVEVKTTEAYAIKTSTLTGYVDELISEKEISNWENAIGLYVVGRPDPNLKQLENSIIAERRTNQLKIISVNYLLSLAEMMNEYDISHDDILAIFRPSKPTLDPLVDLMTRLVSQSKVEESPEEKLAEIPRAVEEVAYWITPVKDYEEETAEVCIKNLVGKEKIYAFGDRTPGRRHIKPGDWICFYATGKGIVAHARVDSYPKNKPHPAVRHSDQYPWVFKLKDTQLYLDNPVVIDSDVRKKLDAFKGKDLDRSWAWFVQSTHRLSEHDFEMLTRRAEQ
ncbi:MAG: EVE domain-containing protein [Thermoplasmata archaeon]|nr:EVE domain-containing protein [Thermoplasmata archaeon]